MDMIRRWLQDRAICSAVERGDVAAVEQLLDANPVLLNAPVGREGLTPLHLAVERGHAAVVETLLTRGADVNIKGGVLRETSLHRAACLGRKDMAALLIARGANVEATDGWGETPLLAVARGLWRAKVAKAEQKVDFMGIKSTKVSVEATVDVEMMQLLLERGANTQARDVYKRTALSLIELVMADPTEAFIYQPKLKAELRASPSVRLGSVKLTSASQAALQEAARLLRSHGAG